MFSETMNERVSLSVRDFLEMLPYLKIFPIPSNALQWRSIEGLCEDRQASSTPQGYLVGREAASLQVTVQGRYLQCKGDRKSEAKWADCSDRPICKW